MTSTALKTSMALPLAAMLTLAGCGGGGSTSMNSDGRPSGTTAPPAGMTTDGLTPSAAERRGATGSTTLATLFSTQPDNAWSPVSGALKRNFDTDTVSLDGVLHVHTVQRTAAGGYLIHYTDGTNPGSIEFGPEHCSSTYCEIRGDDGYHGLWAWTSAEPLGSPSFEHFHVLNLIANPEGEESRIAFVFGLTTPPATLRTLGEAVYSGITRADAYRTGDPDRDFRQRYSGNLRLVANFDMSRLYGRVIGVRGSEPGSSTRNPLPTSSFRISDGAIHDNGQFTATLAGMDTDASVAGRDSVRGVMGRILGEFYGPDGGSVGGVLTASRDLEGDENDLTFHGYFRGGKLGPTVNLATEALTAGIDRDVQASRSALLDDDGMARVERTASGWSVSVNGDTVTFDDADNYGANPRFSTTYWRDLGNNRLAVMFTETRGFSSNQEFDHFDVKGWAYSTLVPGADSANLDFETYIRAASWVYLLHGNRTSAGSMPTTGTGTYAGRMRAYDFPTDDAVSTLGPDATLYRGDATLTAAFGSASLGGRLSNLESRPGDGSDYAAVQGELTFDATITGNRFTASTVTGTRDLAGYGNGSVRGAFFGPAAEEAGGVFDATDAGNNRAMVGWFGGNGQ